jgi:hypothetical protein
VKLIAIAFPATPKTRAKLHNRMVNFFIFFSSRYSHAD